jgi:hypothetical protein
MPLTATQKTSIRRHLKYPVIGLIRTGAVGGGTLASGFAGYRYFQAYGALEYKLNNLAADEEARLLGNAIGAVAIVGNPPNIGDSISVTFSGGPLGSPVTITATYPTNPPPGDGRLWFANQLAAAAIGNATLIGAGFIGLAPYGTGPFAESAVPLPEVQFTNAQPFTIAASFSGQCAPAITAQGGFVPPSTSLDGVNTIYGFLPLCDGLENSWLTASQNLDTIQADVWRGRSNEAGARRSLYEQWVRQMGDFLGVPCFIDANQRPTSMGAMNFA